MSEKKSKTLRNFLLEDDSYFQAEYVALHHQGEGQKKSVAAYIQSLIDKALIEKRIELGLPEDHVFPKTDIRKNAEKAKKIAKR